MTRPSLVPALALLLFAVSGNAPAAEAVHGLAMHGSPKYPSGFTHFEYVNPDAPKGGAVRLHAIGTFDTLHAFTLKGVPAAGLGFLHQSLTARADDEAFSQYGEVAESIQVADDRTWVQYVLREQARWHDGKPITADDVVFSLEILKTRGHPFYRSYFGAIERAEKLDARTVRLHLGSGKNAELPLIAGEMPVLPRHYWEGRDFEATTTEPPLGSGPYRIKRVDPGRSITYERVSDWWAADLPVNRGQNNYDEIRFDYYRDQSVALEAFKSGEYDFRQENNSKLWATAYDTPAREKGELVQELIEHQRPTGMQGFVFNTRREMFASPRVREALAYAFDFEWTNKNLFYGQYTRTRSYFSNSELAATGLPSEQELAILEPLRDKLPARVFTAEYHPPSSAGENGLRKNLRTAIKLLTSEGWALRDRKLTHRTTGTVMEFEILLVSPAFERVVLPFAKNLERLGITARVRTVDTAQYQKRLDEFDFDMVVGSFGQSLSPGNEQRDYWSSTSAGIPGSRNIIGINDPAVDALIDEVIHPESREDLIHSSRALDRTLQWGHFVIPNWHIRAYRVAYWNRFARPEVAPRYALGFQTWWIDRERDTALTRRKR
jgi:microcin C transport system substrate-binding protein